MTKSARIIAVAFMVTLASCSASNSSDKKGFYPIPMDEALNRLSNADIIGFRDARQCGIPVSYTHLRAHETDS